MVPTLRLFLFLVLAGVSLPSFLRAESYSGSATLFYGGEEVGSGMLSFETDGKQLLLSVSGSLEFQGESYPFSTSGDTTYTTSGLSISSRAFTDSEGVAIPAVTISPKTSGSLTYRGTIRVSGYSFVLEVEFSEDEDEDGVFSMVDPTPLGVIPVISAPSLPVGIVERYYRFQISVANRPTTISAEGLPAGLSMEEGGLISGRPTDTGTNLVTFGASNLAGEAVEKSGTLKIPGRNLVPSGPGFGTPTRRWSSPFKTPPIPAIAMSGWGPTACPEQTKSS